MDEHGSSYEVAKGQKGDISTSSNAAYNEVKEEEGVKDSEYEMCDMPSDAAMVTQETTYEAISPNDM